MTRYYSVTLPTPNGPRQVGRIYRVGREYRYAMDTGYAWLGRRAGSISEPEVGDQLPVETPEGRRLATICRVSGPVRH